MAAPDLFETVCPNCSKPFDVGADVAEAHCPYCDVLLRFELASPEPEAPPEPAPEPSPGAPLPVEPEPSAAALPEAPPPTRRGRGGKREREPVPAPAEAEPEPQPRPVETFEPVPPPLPPSFPEPGPPAPGEYPAQCPQCGGPFTIERAADLGTCPYCASALRFEDAYAEAEGQYPVRCPACDHDYEVPASAREGACPACAAPLAFEDEWPGDLRVPPAAVPTETIPVAPQATPEASPETAPSAEAVAMPTPPPVASEEAPESPKRRGFLRRRAPVEPAEAPSEQTPAPTLAAEEASLGEPALPPVVPPPDEGMPFLLSCPTCSKEFGVRAGEREGNCPHCNAPLAFVSEKEFTALKEAEERKKAFQERMAKRRLEEKTRDESRHAAREARAQRRARPEVAEAAPGPKTSLFDRLRRKRPAEAAAPDEAPSPTPSPVEPVAPPVGKPTRRRRREPTPPPAAEEPGPPEVSPAAAAPAKRGLGRFFRKAPEAPAPEPDVGAPGTSIEIAPIEETEVVAAAPPAEPEKPKRTLFGRRKEKAQPAAAPVEAAAIVESEITFESPPPEAAPAPKKSRKTKGVSGAEVAPAPSPPAEAASKADEPKRVRKWFGRTKEETPVGVEAAPAAVEIGSIDFGEPLGEAPPKTKPARKRRPAAEAPMPAPVAPPEPSAGGPAGPPKKGLLGRFRRASSPAPTEAVPVEVASIDFGEEEAVPTPAKKGKKREADGAVVEATIEFGEPDVAPPKGRR